MGEPESGRAAQATPRRQRSTYPGRLDGRGLGGELRRVCRGSAGRQRSVFASTRAAGAAASACAARGSDEGDKESQRGKAAEDAADDGTHIDDGGTAPWERAR